MRRFVERELGVFRCQRSEAEIWLTPSFRCYLFKFRFYTASLLQPPHNWPPWATAAVIFAGASMAVFDGKIIFDA
jgi:hypothetical protein